MTRKYDYDYRKNYFKKRRDEYKAKAIEYLGGRCAICNYDRCASALDFHHKSGEKDFAFSSNFNLSWNRIQEELGKCVLLCANCHREVHAGISTL